ncbi:hypothetical protein NKDENANG_03309 [Candidatus Entotheonellaceae bacterium PAL068K]
MERPTERPIEATPLADQAWHRRRGAHRRTRLVPASQQPRPAPARRPYTGLAPFHTWLVRRRDDCSTHLSSPCSGRMPGRQGAAAGSDEAGASPTLRVQFYDVVNA